MRGSAALRTTVTPGGALAGPWVRDELWRRARAVPSLDLRFAERKSLVDASGAQLVTFTRASSGTYVDSTGTIKTAATNEARFDHNPTTGESLGLLVEEQRTNSVTNNTMVGAIAGTPGTLPTGWGTFVSPTGLTRTIVGSGTVNGINYIDVRFNGTPSSTSEITLYLSAAITATLGQAWTSTAWLSLAGGSTSNIAAISLRNFELNSGTYVREIGTNFVSNISSDFIRRQNTTSSFGASANQISLALSIFATAGGTPIDITLRIGLPQLEQGAFATSVIPTSTAAATRSADVASISGSNFSSWYRQDEGTVFADATLRATYPGINTFPYLLQIDDGSNANRVSFDWSLLSGGNRYNYAVSTNNSIQFEIGPFGLSTSSARMAAAMKTLSFASAVSTNPSTVYTNNTGTLAATMSQIRFGAGFGQQFSGTIRRLTYWPQRLSNNVLQELTR